MPPQKNDILQGTLALLVLKSLATQGKLHGYAITAYIQRASADLLRVEEGSLYPALHRMEQDGIVQQRKEPSRAFLHPDRRRQAPAGARAGTVGPPD